MTLHDAYLKAKDDAKRRNYTLLISCGDYGEFWGFVFRPPTKEELNGVGEITINKMTGEVGYFFPHEDFDLYDKRKSIPITQFTEKEAPPKRIIVAQRAAVA